MTATVIKTEVRGNRTVYTVRDGSRTYKTTTKPGSVHTVDWQLHRQLSRQLIKATGKEWWALTDQMLANLGD